MRSRRFTYVQVCTQLQKLRFIVCLLKRFTYVQVCTQLQKLRFIVYLQKISKIAMLAIF